MGRRPRLECPWRRPHRASGRLRLRRERATLLPVVASAASRPGLQRRRGASSACEGGQNGVPVVVEEFLVVGADLSDVHLVEPGLDTRAQRGDVLLAVVATGHRGADHVGRDEFACLLEVHGCRQDLRELAGQQFDRPQPVHQVHGLVPVIAPTDLRRPAAPRAGWCRGGRSRRCSAGRGGRPSGR